MPSESASKSVEVEEKAEEIAASREEAEDEEVIDNRAPPTGK